MENTKENMQSRNIGICQMVVCAVLWSIAGVFIGLLDMNGFVIAGGRSLFAALTVLAYMALTKQKIIFSRDTLVSGILLCGDFICFVVANKYTTAANAIVLQYTAPIFILIFSFLFLHKKPRALDVVTVLLTLGGISLFFFDSLDAGKLVGNLLGITAGAFMGGMFVAVGNTKGEEKMSSILFGHVFCAAVGLPFAAFTENTWSLTGIGILALLGVVQLGIPYILYALASKRCSTVTCSVLAAIEPLLNPVWVALTGGGVPGTFALVGGAFLVIVITLYSVLDARMPAKSAE